MPDLSSGLLSSQVPGLRAAHGANVLTPPPRTPGWKLYLEKFDDPVIRILMIAAAIAIAVGAVDGHIAEGVGILVAILLATFLAYWNESRAAREFAVLNTTSDDIPVKVIRDGGYTIVPKRDIVVGDVAFIEVGEEVPADGVLMDAGNLQVNESRLTGESVAVGKQVPAKLLRGTTIVEGYAVFSVTAVGDKTEIGSTLVESIEETGDDSPLKKQLAELSKIIGVVGFGVALLAFLALGVSGVFAGTLHLNASEYVFFAILGVALAVGLANIWMPILWDAFELVGIGKDAPAWLGTGKSWFVTLAGGGVLFAILIGFAIVAGGLTTKPTEWIDLADAQTLLRNFMIAVTIIVVAVPEGLAMSVTLSLAYSMRKMTASNTLVRRMDACETIGAATVICSDKTGTLTMNQMRVFEAVIAGSETAKLPVSPVLRRRVIEAIAANSTAHLTYQQGMAEPVGNPSEGALLLWLHDNGVDYLAARNAFAITTQWNFNTERKYMATLGQVLHVKGAPEILLGMCQRIATADGDVPLNSTAIAIIESHLKSYQSRGMRVLALVEGLPGHVSLDSKNFTWLALVAIADPIRTDVPDAITACHRAGVGVKIVTGDNAATAAEIGRQIGLDVTDTITGPEFAALDDATAKARAGTLSVLARARPADKLRLVRLLKERGEVVAVTGDGVNDGPALNYADVGLAMGKSGTSVAREASDIILLDDSFPSILNAVRWGRALYENIQRFILFQLTINVVALGLAVLGPFLGYDLPLTVMQMLWVNLIMDTFAALALATEPPHEGVLDRSPRSPAAFIVTRPMSRGIFGVGFLFLLLLIGLIVYFQQTGELAVEGASRAGTIIFTVFVLLQFWNLFNAKAFGRGGSVIPTLSNNPSFLGIAAAILVGQILLVQFGGEVFRTVPLSLADWGLLLGTTALVLIIGEVWRLLRRG